MERIVIIAPYRDFGVMAKQLAKEMNIKVEVYEGWMEHIGDFIKIIPGREIDVVISRGGTADYIARHVQAPVLSVNASFYDLLECCEAARRQSRQIVLTSYKQPFAGTYLIEKAMDIQIAHLVFNRLADIYEQLGVYAAAGNYCVVGGGPTVQAARRLGLPSVILRTGRDTIRDALQRAAEIARIRYKQRRLQSTLQVLADVVQ